MSFPPNLVEVLFELIFFDKMLFCFEPQFPVIEFDTFSNANICEKIESCQDHIKQIDYNLQKYVTKRKPFRKQKVSAIQLVPLSLVDYIKGMRKIHKGNAVREVQKAEKKNYHCEIFHVQNHIEDFVEINHSKEIRQGKKMTKSYQKDIRDYGGLPKTIQPMETPECPVHFSQWIGVFKPMEGHKQGEILVGKQLVGYINLIRLGEIILYGSILGHGDYLKDGIMYLLNHKAIEWILTSDKSKNQRIKYIMYAGWNDGTEGLQKWKKRTLFAPFYLKSLE
jgi:hypothetical protein